MIIGLTGPKSSGKTSVAKVLEGVYGFSRRSFSSPIKGMLETMGVPIKYLYDPDYKETTVPGFGKSAREMMQSLGSEWGRALVSRDVWCKALERRIEGAREDIVVDDLRFPNECAMIHALKGVVVKVHRPNLVQDDHSSEMGVPPSDIDAEIRNLSCYLPDLRAAVVDFMETGKYGNVHATKPKRFANI